jgi:hypothetical protein
MATNTSSASSAHAASGGAGSANSVISSAYDREIRPFIDLIDQFRAFGVQQDSIDLPQICVMGDQSSGKSSVLQAISGNIERICGFAGVFACLRVCTHFCFVAWLKIDILYARCRY